MISVIVFMKPFSFFDVKINRRVFIRVLNAEERMEAV